MPNYDLGPKRKKISPYLLIAAIAVLLVLIAYLLGLLSGGGGKISGRKLRCVVSQDVTVFGDRVLYYDDSTLFCLSTAGSELWSVQVGSGARFHAGSRHVVVWTTNQLQILDRNGRSTYNDRLSETIQFARVCDKYVAIVTGDGVSPTLTIKDMDGGLVDTEVNNYADLMLLDCGFFGDSEYLWTTALDVYGAVPETTMHTYRVGQLNTGDVSLGEPITYAVVYSGSYLNVINTRQLRLYDYRGTQNTDNTVLVYGWQLVGNTPTSGDPYLLFAPVLQTDTAGSFSELRLLHGKTDTRYSLPDSCVGAAIHGKRLYAFSGNSLYRADISAQRFTALRLPVDGTVTDYLGMTSNGVALLVCGTSVWAVSVP